MGKKYDVHYDPYQTMYANAIRGQADKITGLAQGYQPTGVADYGKAELAKIKSGDYTGTALGGMVNNIAARDLQRLKESFRLGTNTMRRDGANSLLSHERQLRAAEQGARQRAGDLLTRGIGSYTEEMAGLADDDNRTLDRRINAEGAAAGLLGNAAATQRAGTTVTEKKGFWSKLGSVLSGAGSLAAGLLSDEKTKKNVKPVLQRKAAEKIKKLKVKDFEYKDGYADEGEHTGLMAGATKKVMPEVVTKGADGLRRVDMASVFAQSVAALQNLQSRVETLEGKREKK